MVSLYQPLPGEWPHILRTQRFRDFRVADDALPTRALLEQYLLGVSDSPLSYRYGVPFLIVLESTGTVVGNIGGKGLTSGDSEVELGYQTARPYRNQGIMTGAIEKMQELARGDRIALLAHIEPENEASRRVLKKCAFQLEALVRLPASLDLERWSWSPD